MLTAHAEFKAFPEPRGTWLGFGAQYRLSGNSVPGATLASISKASADILSAQLTYNF